MMRTDVVIVGAGLAGTSLAWHLAGRRDVLVVEQGSQHCAEASAQNAGMVRRLVGDPTERALACRTFELLQQLPSNDWQGAEPFTRTGSMVAVCDSDSPQRAKLDRACAGLRDAGIAVAIVSGADIAALAPAFTDSPATRGYWIADEGVCDPHTLGSGFVRGARRQGAEFWFDTRVLSLQTSGGRVTGIVTERGVITAEHIVLATAAWTPGLVREFGITRRIRPLARHLFFSDPHEFAAPGQPWCWIEDRGVYVRPETGGFLCSPCDETEVPPPVGPGSKRNVDPMTRAEAQEKLVTALPALGTVRLGQGWVGLRTFTEDRRPLVGADPDVEGLIWMTALGGSGVGVSFALGERLAAELISQPPARLHTPHCP